MRPLDDTLKARCRLGVVIPLGDQRLEFLVDIVDKRLLQNVDVDRTGLHDGAGIAIVGEREKQMFERGIFVMMVVGDGQRAVERLFERA